MKFSIWQRNIEAMLRHCWKSRDGTGNEENKDEKEWEQERSIYITLANIYSLTRFSKTGAQSPWIAKIKRSRCTD